MSNGLARYICQAMLWLNLVAHGALPGVRRNDDRCKMLGKAHGGSTSTPPRRVPTEHKRGDYRWEIGCMCSVAVPPNG